MRLKSSPSKLPSYCTGCVAAALDSQRRGGKQNEIFTVLHPILVPCKGRKKMDKMFLNIYSWHFSIHFLLTNPL